MRRKITSSALAMLLLAVLALVPVQLAFATPPSVNITSPTASETVGSDFTVTGTASANVSVQVSVNGDVIDTVTADGSGNWSVEVTGQSDGAKSITATATNSPLVYVGTFAAGNTYVFDTTDNTQVVGSPFPTTAGLVPGSVSNDGAMIYMIPASGGDTYGIMDTSDNSVATYSVPGANLGGGVFSSDGSTLYLTDQGTAVVHVIETTTFTVTNTINVGNSNLSLTISENDTTLYIGSNGTSEVYKIDLSDNSYDTITTTTQPGTLLLNNAGDRLYTSHSTGPGSIGVINTDTNTEIDIITTGDTLGDMAILPDDSKLYVTSSTDNTVSVVDTASNTELSSISVGTFPYGLDITSDGSKVYLVAIGDIFGAGTNGGVWEINTVTDTATEFFETDDGSILPISVSDFIVQETAMDTVSITVSADTDEEDTLADTGTNRSIVLFTSAVLVLGAGFVLRRYNSYA